MKISVSLFPAVTAWMGSSVRFRVVNTKVSDVKTNEQSIFLGVLGSVQNVYGKIANCSAAEGNVSIWVCPNSLSKNRPCLAERPDLYPLVQVQIPHFWGGKSERGKGTSAFGWRRSGTGSGMHPERRACCGWVTVTYKSSSNLLVSVLITGVQIFRTLPRLNKATHDKWQILHLAFSTAMSSFYRKHVPCNLFT